MHERLALAELATLIEVGPIYPVNMGVDEPILLRANAGSRQVGMSVAIAVRIAQTGSQRRLERYEVVIVEYLYALTTDDSKEILAFHWTPETADPNQRTFPHLHVGAINLNANGPIRPGSFHKIHIPTSHVSVESVIRLAITELNARPLRPNWEQILTRTERSRGVAHEHPA
jgi:hypothetical protein